MNKNFRLSVDVGGTFTDFVVEGIAPEPQYFKHTSTPSNAVEGIFGGIQRIAESSGMSAEDFLKRCESVSLGTTVATNAILEHKTARTALLTTEGFRDILLIREGGKSDTYNIRVDFPEPYIPRYLTYGIRERVLEDGSVAIPLDETRVRALLEELGQRRIEAIAVSLLWSIANPAHERRIGELIAEILPEVPFSLGHNVSPIIREYRRTSTVAIDASLKPVVQTNITNTYNRLVRHSFEGNFMLVTSSGGRISLDEAIARPVHLCLSGPSGAPQASSRIAAIEGSGDDDLITIDMGGTSFDVSISSGGEAKTHREGSIGGNIFAIPSVDIVTIGAGGGSIAWVDIGGLLHVGPHSAGAFPGPACYQRGGDEPTVTDANVVRGMLNHDRFANGMVPLSVEKARDVIGRRVADPLGIGIEEAAGLISAVVEQNMVAAIEDITIKRGIDPRDFALVAGGAAAGSHAAAIALALGISKVIVPKSAGVLSAYGIASGNIKLTFSCAFRTSSDRFDHAGVERALREAESEGLAFLDRMKVEEGRRKLLYSVQACYRHQVWNLTLPLSASRIDDARALEAVVEAFHQLHERQYLVRSEGDIVEFSEWSVEAIGLSDNQPTASNTVPLKRETRQARAQRGIHLAEGGLVQVRIYDRDGISPDETIRGPAIIEDPLTSIFVPFGVSAAVTVNGNVIMNVVAAESAQVQKAS